MGEFEITQSFTFNTYQTELELQGAGGPSPLVLRRNPLDAVKK